MKLSVSDYSGNTQGTEFVFPSDVHELFFNRRKNNGCHKTVFKQPAEVRKESLFDPVDFTGYRFKDFRVKYTLSYHIQLLFFQIMC